MTICISVSVAEGLVMAADSAVTLSGQVNTAQGPLPTAVFQQFNFANKVTRFKDYPIGVMSWGVASISDRSIQSLIMEFEHGYPQADQKQKFTVKSVADDLLGFMKKRYNDAYTAPSQQPNLGLFVGGFSEVEFFADAYSCDLANNLGWTQVRPPKPDGRPSFGANWFGQIGPLLRLIKGVDLAALSELVNRGADKAIVQKWADDNVPEFHIVFDGMPLQDAIDFANYAAQVVIGAFRFGLGPPLCGGDVDIAVITPGSFGWAKKKQWGITE